MSIIMAKPSKKIERLDIGFLKKTANFNLFRNQKIDYNIDCEE